MGCANSSKDIFRPRALEQGLQIPSQMFSYHKWKRRRKARISLKSLSVVSVELPQVLTLTWPWQQSAGCSRSQVHTHGMENRLISQNHWECDDNACSCHINFFFCQDSMAWHRKYVNEHSSIKFIHGAHLSKQSCSSESCGVNRKDQKSKEKSGALRRSQMTLWGHWTPAVSSNLSVATRNPQ